MAGEKKIDRSVELKDSGSKSDSVTKLAAHDMAFGRSGRSDFASGYSASTNKRGNTHHNLAADQGVHYAPTSGYDYYCPGYDGTYREWDNQGYFPRRDRLDIQHSGIQTSIGPMVYYAPGYNTYPPGTGMDFDGQYVAQQPYFLCGPDVMSSYSYDSSLFVGGSTNQAVVGGPKSKGSTPNFASSFKSKGANLIKASAMTDNKSTLMSNLKLQNSNASRNLSSSAPHFEPLNKVQQQGSALRTSGISRGYCYPTQFSVSIQRQQNLHPQNGFPNFTPNGRTCSGGDKFFTREKFNRNDVFDSSNHLTRGPRGHGRKHESCSSDEIKPLHIPIQRDRYNLPEFVTEYEQAMFFVIKSFSEDDIHKSIKYNVWASTPGGNKKLDAAYQEAEAILLEKGNKCPVFLFFSVNGSGQFVGLAEMIGQVDFKKTMDFWQQDKWTGFFPLKWHIIKDVSNSQLRHIILENNDYKSVTNSRDTQEIKFKQGLEMLTIFKSYPANTLLLDDFYFYEDREKANPYKKSNRESQPELELKTDNNHNYMKHSEAEVCVRPKSSEINQSLSALTKNLSLHEKKLGGQ